MIQQQLKLVAFVMILEASKRRNIWTFNYTDLNVVGEFVVIEREITDLGDDHG
jgi:hypothetical protein